MFELRAVYLGNYLWKVCWFVENEPYSKSNHDFIALCLIDSNDRQEVEAVGVGVGAGAGGPSCCANVLKPCSILVRKSIRNCQLNECIMWLIDYPQVHNSHECGNKLLCFRYYGGLNLNCLAQTDPLLVTDVDDDYYVLSDEKKNQLLMKQSSQKPKLKTKLKLKFKDKIQAPIVEANGFDNKAFQGDSDYIEPLTHSSSKKIDNIKTEAVQNTTNDSGSNYYQLWHSESSIREARNDLKVVKLNQISPPPLPPRAIKKLMHERRMCQLSTPPLVPRQYKPKNLPVPSDHNKNDNDNDNDTLFEFDVTDKDEHGINSFLDVQLLGIAHSDGSLSDCLDLCSKSKPVFGTAKIRSRAIGCDNYVSTTFTDGHASDSNSSSNSILNIINGKKPLKLRHSNSMKESNFCKKSPFTTDTSSSSSSSKRSELQLGHETTTHRPKRLQPRLLQSLGHPEVNNNIIEAVADNYELLPSNWEARMDSSGRVFYIDHENKITTWSRPNSNSKPVCKRSQEEKHRKQLERRYESINRTISENDVVGLSTRIMSNPPHPMLKFLCRPDFFSILHMNQEALSIYTSNSAVKQLVSKIRRDANVFEKYQHYPDFVSFVNFFSDPKQDLPTGWEAKTDDKNNAYFIDHLNRKTTFMDPRLPNEWNTFANTLAAPNVAPRPCSSSNSSVSSSTSDISTIDSTRGPHPYNEQIVAFLRQLNIMHILEERYSAISKSSQLRERINVIRTEGKVALDRFSDDLQLAIVLSLFEEEIMSYVPCPPPQLPAETNPDNNSNVNDCGRSDDPNSDQGRQKFESKLRNFYKKLESKGYGKGPLKLRLNIRRDHLLEDAFKSIMAASKKELQKAHLYVSWDKEDCLDQGGPSREFFFLLSRELFNPYYGLFEYSANGIYTVQISPMSTFVDNYHDWFRFCGRVLGLALVNKYLLDVYFIRPIYKKLLKLPVSLSDLQSLDAEFYQSLHWIRDNDLSDLSQPLDLSFVVTEEIFGQITERELKPGGRNTPVTDKNKKEYLDRVVKWRLERGISEQIDWLIQGFYEVVDYRLISMFDAQELEFVIAGTVELDVKDWQQHTEYYIYRNDDQAILWFWQAIQKFTNEQRLRLLQFVTGTSSIPYEGFKALRGANGSRRFCIAKSGTKNMLPRAQTCFNRLELPPYPSFDILYEKLLLAVQETNTFGLQ